MLNTSKFMVGAALLAVLLIGYVPKALAQNTTTIVGRVQDAQGAVVPNAAVTLTSETRSISFPTKTSSTGDFIFPNVPGDTYKVAVELTGFKKVERAGILGTPGDTVAIPVLTLEVGAVSETVEVTGEAPLVQTTNGERSFVVETQALENVPVQGTFFALQVALTPGVSNGASTGPTRDDASGGSTARTNYMLDGVTTINTGGNQPGINLNMDSVAEVKVLTNSYSAEYGRSSGLQVVGVTKSGSEQLHGSLHDIEEHSGWNSNSWAGRSNGTARSYNLTRFWGGTLGGPVGKLGGKSQHKLFWFLSEEVQPVSSGGSVGFIRVPTALERQGNFSQTTDNNGALFNTITNSASGLPCTATSTAGCYGTGGTLGVIPASQLYNVGLAILNQYPMPNLASGVNIGQNLEITKPRNTVTAFQMVERADWNVSQKLRISGKYSGQNDTQEFTYGSLPGFNDTLTKFPALIVPSLTVVYTFTPTFLFEGTVGYTRGNELTSGMPADAAASRCFTAGSALCNIPYLYPNAEHIPPVSYEAKLLTASDAGWYDPKTGYFLLQPQYSWGSRISGGPPNAPFPGFVNWQYTIDSNLGLTKIWGKHTIKGGFSSQDSMKIQNLGTQGAGILPNEGSLNFGNSTTNPLDSGFGFSNAALGVFSSYAEQSAFIEGRYVYHNNDFYLTDNWKVSKKLTLDMGMRFVHNGPQYDSREQAGQFFPNQWLSSQAPQLFQPGCAVAQAAGAACSTANKVAVNPVTGQSLGIDTSSIIGDIVPNTGNPLNGIVTDKSGTICKTNYCEPMIVFGPRFGAAYALTPKIVLRGGLGLFYDRPQGDAIFYQTGNPPQETQGTVYNATLQSVAAGTATAYQAPPAILVYNYQANVPASFQFNFGSQFVLPWASLVDVSFVQDYNYNTVAWGTIGTGAGTALDLNAPDLGTAYLSQYQDKTLGTSTIPGATAFTTNLLRPYRGYGNIEDTWPRYNSLYSSIVMSYKRQYGHGITGGFNEALGLRNTGNQVQAPILQHTATSTGIAETFSPQYYANGNVINNVGFRRHILKGYLVWELPKTRALGKLGDYAVNGWQLSTVYTGSSGAPYDVGFSYTTNGSSVELTGSPNYAARVVVGPNAGSGCSGNQWQMFNTAAFSGPTYGSVGNESGSNLFHGCWSNVYDMALQRSFPLFSEKKRISFRVDAFNVFNLVNYNNPSASMTLASPAANASPTNNQFLANGTINPARVIPQNAGFGAVGGAGAMRSMQATFRFTF